jgi:Ig-like domain CHU_C associated
MMFIISILLHSRLKIMQLFFIQTAAHKDYSFALRKSFLIKTFSIVVALIGFNAVGLLAQTVPCATRIEESGGGGTYDLFFAAEPYATCPTGTLITINGANYVVDNCGQLSGGEYYVSLVFDSGTPVVLATAAPVTIGTCAYNNMGNLICTPPTLMVTSTSSAICAGSSVNLATLVTSTGTLSFYTNRTDAQNGTNALPSGTVTTAVATNYYVRSINAQGCFSVAEITVLMSAPVCGIIQVTAN